MMKTLRLDNEQAENAFRAIADDYTVVAPKRCAGRGRFSDTDLTTYETVESLGEIEFSAKTYFSAKSVLLPIREVMFSFNRGEAEEVRTSMPPTIVFLRACDIHALAVLDAMFLEHGGREDCYYARRRENMICFLLECPGPFDECFCVSMGTSRTKDYAVFIRPEAEGYAAEIMDDRFERYFPFGDRAHVAPRFSEEDPIPVALPRHVEASLFADASWKEYSQRCIACGRCNTSCPTCTCFTVQDIPAADDRDSPTRQRIWSSCQVKDFSLLAGNHDFRLAHGDKMRYRVLHKITDFAKTFGLPMCVGCGRCDIVCPEYISMRKCIETINTICRRGAEVG
ncbi:hypothetical protein LCGC14_0016200 [marine sediment metagenome]|uniref:4Fe-4S ferredoxin-type domain-containing protein n=1 Tax=marine sediment metagenome TaxID=412755 RepID=A0A0F9Z207_9ZZZZ|nr:anaerobic sulfite reductase subunit A [Phycisphaerae bacterium]HDZ42832.1 anaerobic sulfite reductase subunit A [Phycisphaerae bacterium]